MEALVAHFYQYMRAKMKTTRADKGLSLNPYFELFTVQTSTECIK